jgi:hypothetical protein
MARRGGPLRSWCQVLLACVFGGCAAPRATDLPDGSDGGPTGHADGPSRGDVVAETAPALVHDPALRRLSRVEYRNAVEALLGVPVPADVVLPVDPDTRGFDDQADALEVSPLLFEAYEAVAERVVEAALRRQGLALVDAPLPPRDRAPEGDGWVTLHALDWGADLAPPVDGTWRLHVPLEIPVDVPDGTTVVSVFVDDAPVGRWTTPSVPGRVATTFDVPAEAFRHALAIAVAPLEPGLVDRYRLGPVTVTGPLEAGPNPARDALVSCDLDGDTAGCTAEIVGRVAARAFRRPLDPGDLDALLALPLRLLDAGAEPDEALGVGLRVVLTHPRFLFRVEPDDRPGAARPLDAWELAARLAGTLWASLPDDALAADAASGALLDDATLRAQVRRMLADPRALALADVFVADWLDLAVLDQATPDPMIYPTFDDDLRAAMREEVVALVRGLVGTGAPVDTLLTATRGVVPPRLAEHYALGPVAGDDVDLAAVGRGGLLGTAAVLTQLAHPDRGSPTVRGKFVLDKLLCEPPQPPPGNVPSLAPGTSNQDRVEEHARNPVCAGCHRTMDPLGLALEHFDGVGAWRDLDGGEPVRAVGTLPDGTTVDGLAGLERWIVEDPRWPRCVARQLFTWALGRPPGTDDDVVEAVGARLAAGGSLDDAVEALVTSAPFRARRGSP